MKYATRKVVSAAAIAVGVGLAAAASPTSAGSMNSYELSGPSAAVWRKRRPGARGPLARQLEYGRGVLSSTGG